MIGDDIVTKEELLIKADGVKDCVKQTEKKIKEEKKLLEIDKKDYQSFGMYDDCGSIYEQHVIKREARIEVLIEQKISLEKYMRKLRHEAKETTTN